jgi:hypothetical protein
MAEGASAHGPRAFKGPALYSVLIFCHVAAWTKKGRQKPQGHKSKITLVVTPKSEAPEIKSKAFKAVSDGTKIKKNVRP